MCDNGVWLCNGLANDLVVDRVTSRVKHYSCLVSCGQNGARAQSYMVPVAYLQWWSQELQRLLWWFQEQQW